ncbi:Oxoglutarate iron-dependent dioxygenase [Pyrenophora seminiperda CCB06]|uniref:Oxoglutarate iron-dependent dioxygenase n=1 Tax=Pyrenophora seminiperda CCB06 TaxID=1302712 RepID=A0A3M7M2I3_9PLEO|nr:Oxoglutarate iron-dependent dioxygenase [Pyrenophora seminiperda CCB06]
MYTQENRAATPPHDATDLIAQALADVLTEVTYTCGGAIEAVDDSGSTSGVTIRWDSTDATERITLPCDKSDAAQSSFDKLLKGTTPASFGFQGKDVIDESYRKASKLDASTFSTDFCPYYAGIIDVIGQALLATFKKERGLGIRAELYKLNVYQAPSGLFKPHVDTPRSELQFGSLVVCLPCEHEGGQLVVRREGHSTTFDWTGSANKIHWAAFYSDCEHEVLEVTSGHRITLTYNLYARHGLGELTGHTNAIDLEQLPLYQKVKAALQDPSFMPEGGTLGIYCLHAYAHANEVGAKTLPPVLKGADMVAYEVFRALGVIPDVRPILYLDPGYKYELKGYKFKTEEEREVANWARVGDKLSSVCMSKYEHDFPYQLGEYPHKLVDVLWLNKFKRGTHNLQYTYLAYGNEASLEHKYSHCALLFEIPTADDRVTLINI